MMYPSHSQFDDLLMKLYQAAQIYHGRAADYYSVITQSPAADKSKAAQEYRIAGEVYLDILFTCEQYLLSVERDEELEIELVHIQAIRHSVQLTQLHL